ncbi:MAG: amino acid-binding protein [Candidatus Thorarchaeota archaeon]|nr:amino acid-binding protein [Candidatus Thorarchaeota archaeon]
MWKEIVEYFEDSPQRLRVAQAIIRHGFRVEAPGVIKCRAIRVPLKAIGEALGIDRRTVQMTTERICANSRLRDFFSRLEPAGVSLENVRKVLGYGCVTIYVDAPENPGIVSEVTTTIASHRIAIRQVIAEDAAIYEEPCLKVLTTTPLPGEVIQELTVISGVKKVIIEQ